MGSSRSDSKQAPDGPLRHSTKSTCETLQPWLSADSTDAPGLQRFDSRHWRLGRAWKLTRIHAPRFVRLIGVSCSITAWLRHLARHTTFYQLVPTTSTDSSCSGAMVLGITRTCRANATNALTPYSIQRLVLVASGAYVTRCRLLAASGNRQWPCARPKTTAWDLMHTQSQRAFSS